MWNGKITEKSETMAFLGQDPVRCKIVVDNKCLQARHFKHLGSEISYENVHDIQQKITKIFSNTGNYKQ
jgi:hypothetical protein